MNKKPIYALIVVLVVAATAVPFYLVNNNLRTIYGQIDERYKESMKSNEDLMQVLANAEKGRGELEIRLREREEKITALSAQLKEQSLKSNTYETENKKKREELDRLMSQNEAYKKEYARIVSELDSLQKQYTEDSGQYNDLLKEKELQLSLLKADMDKVLKDMEETTSLGTVVIRHKTKGKK